MHDGELGLAAAAHDGHHAVALAEAGGAWAECLDLARQLEPRDVGRRVGRRRIGTLALEHVGAVQARCADADEKLRLAGLRIGTVLDHQRPVLDGYSAHAGGIYPGRVKAM